MTKQDFFIQYLQQECGEVIQAASKYALFGPESFHPDDPDKKTNREKLSLEIIDVLAVVQVLGMNDMLAEITPKQIEELTQKKLHKIDHFLCACEEVGTVDPEPEAPSQ